MRPPLSSRIRPAVLAAGLALLLALVASFPAAAQEPASAPPASVTPSSDAVSEEATEFFRRQCARCHTIGGGRLTGPDLANVHQRRDREWLVRFLLDPQAMIDAGDPYALELLESARGVVMPQVAGMDEARARALLDLIERESALEDSEFSTPALPADPFTDSDRLIGRMLFTGKAPLRSGAPPCSGCHDLAGLEGWGGGRLGPDLSRVYERFGSRAAVSEWLQDPTAASHPSSGSESDAAPPALPAHRAMESSEVHPLSAALEEAARHGPAAAAPHQLVFSAAGWGAASLVLALVGLVLWRLPKDEPDAVGPGGAPRWSGPALALGVAGVAVLHLLPLLAADIVAGWLRKPETLQALETAHLAAGLLVLLGLLGRFRRRRGTARPGSGHSLADRTFVAVFALAVVSGLLAALFHRWGLAWLASWIAPSLGDLLRGEGDAGALMGALPLLVRLHVASGALALLLLPFSRWRSLLDPRRLDPRGVEWGRLDPRRLLRLLPARRSAGRRTAGRRTAKDPS